MELDNYVDSDEVTGFDFEIYFPLNLTFFSLTFKTFYKYGKNKILPCVSDNGKAKHLIFKFI
jgi:hypothetical protein